MFKKILAILAATFALTAFAAVDVNKATDAELDSVKGIGPVTSKLILDERKKNGNYKSWEDFIKRVTGVGEIRASEFSNNGLTVGGASYAKAGNTTTQKVKDDAKTAGQQTKETAEKVADKTKEVAKKTADKTKEVAKDTKDKVSNKQ